MTAGMVSLRAMLGGTFQYGLNTTFSILSMKMGVGLSFFPVTTRMGSTTWPFWRCGNGLVALK